MTAPDGHTEMDIHIHHKAMHSQLHVSMKYEQSNLIIYKNIHNRPTARSLG